MVLRARRVGYVYGEGTGFATPALASVDATVEPGRLLLVAGATGSGKTTLLRILAGLLLPTSGDVTVDGGTPEPAGSDPTRRVGLVFQRPESQLFSESVLADVSFGPLNLGMTPEDARLAALEALGSVGLAPDVFSDRSPFGLSGGEARRVALAGVLAMDPCYLLLDEPTAGLDAAGCAAVHQVLDGAKATRGVVVVTHDLEEYLPSADDVLILQGGAQLFSGSVGDFLEAAVADAGGLPVPETALLQVLARRRGVSIERIETDPVSVAETLARSGRWLR